ncbi:MAG: long-chain fatty acid--CoA ligase [Phycisphaerales bacterium]|nr:long-chain fatty acid--CoA ligase [Phycisphaerales bacterium]
MKKYAYQYTSRLFDAIEYNLNNAPKNDMLSKKENGAWRSYSSQEVYDTIQNISAGLLEMGIKGIVGNPEGSDKVAIIAQNAPEWIMIDIAVQQTAAILVPLYPTTSDAEIQHILNESQAKIIFVGDQNLYKKISELQSQIPSLQHIFSIATGGVNNLTNLIQKGATIDKQALTVLKQSIPDSHVATLIYTSGTTGLPKGVMLTHKNIFSNVFAVKEDLPIVNNPNLHVLSFLPLNHIFEKMATYGYLFSFYSIHYAESLDKLGENILEVRPDIITVVPRLLEKIYAKILAKGATLRGIKKKLFFWSLQLSTQFQHDTTVSFWYQIQLFIARKLVFSKWRAALGNNIKYIVCGGAHAPEIVLRAFGAAGIKIIEGYGITENSPIITCNRLSYKKNLIGTVGQSLHHQQVRLAEDGEILVKGDSVMIGYYKHPELNEQAYTTDGWLKTGDIGIWEQPDFLKITGRKKELFKTSGGKFVAPNVIEEIFKNNPMFEQVMVIGENRKFVSALIVPDFAYLTTLKIKNIAMFSAGKKVQHKTDRLMNNTKFSNHYLINDTFIMKSIHETIEHINTQLNHVEQIKKYVILENVWTSESGEMTPKLSMRRKIIEDKYKTQIEAMYQDDFHD